MRILLRALLGLAAALLLAAGALFVASHYGGERVTLRTRDAAGEAHTTPLWVVDLEGRPFLRAGDRESGWVARLRAEPEVALQRNGRWRRYRAEPAPTRTAEVSELMAEKYGLADRVVGLVRNPEASLAIRLEPAPEPKRGSAPRRRSPGNPPDP